MNKGGITAYKVNTYGVCGDAVASKLGNRLADTLVYATNEVLVPNEIAIDELKSHVNAKTDLIIGIGSGVINDLCKHVSFISGLPYYISILFSGESGEFGERLALVSVQNHFGEKFGIFYHRKVREFSFFCLL